MPVLRRGCDSYAHANPNVLDELHYDFAWQYLLGSPDKDLTGPVAQSLLNAGKDIIINAENDATDADGGFANGVKFGQLANQQADALGAPHGSTCIIYSVDAPRSPGQVIPYFQGIASVPGGRRRGGYGGTEFIPLLQSGLIDIWGQANAGSWSGSSSSSFATHSMAHFRQYLATSHAGFSFDPQDQMRADCGFWLSPHSNNPSVPDPPATVAVQEDTVIHEVIQPGAAFPTTIILPYAHGPNFADVILNLGADNLGDDHNPAKARVSIGSSGGWRFAPNADGNGIVTFQSGVLQVVGVNAGEIECSVHNVGDKPVSVSVVWNQVSPI